MALLLPPSTPVTNSCFGLSYSPPLLVQHFKYEFTINSVPGPTINILINNPEIPIYIPFPKLFGKIPKIDTGCKMPRQDLIFPGVPCEPGTCTKRMCQNFYVTKVCGNVDYPCPQFRGQIYLEDDNSSTIQLFTIPKTVLLINANSSSDAIINVELTSNNPISIWIDFLIDSGLSSEGITDQKSVLDRLIVTAKKTLSSLLAMLANYYINKNLVMELSIKITKLVLDIKWDLRVLQLYVLGSKNIEVRNATYTFKNIDILKLIQAESIELTLSNDEIVFQYTIGTYKLDVNPTTIITTMIRDKIALIKSTTVVDETPSTPGFQIPKRSELEKLEDALSYLENLTDIGEFIPGINKAGLNYMKKFLDALKITITISLRFCPLAGVTGVCCAIGFDLTDYLRIVGDFIANDAKDGLNFLKKYDPIPSDSNIPELNRWNDLFEQANRQIITGAGVVLDGISSVLNNDTQFFYGGATLCAPI